jgi:sodium ion-translocating decarboxylase beta subunit
MDLIQQLFGGFTNFTLGNAVMITVGIILVTLAIWKEFEPVLLLPIGFGCILANLGMAATVPGTWTNAIYMAGIDTELFPLIIFIGVGAMIDFTPLLAMPYTVLLGAAGQFGIYGTLMLALALGFPMNQAASIGVIGAIDGPTAIFVSKILAPELLGPIAVAAYSYMSLIPIIQPPIMKLLTTKKERAVRMEYSVRPVSHRALLVFPIVVTIFISMLAPQAAPLIATLMLGNLLRVAGVVERLNKTAQNELINIATLFLGLCIGATMTAEAFLNWKTIGVLALGLVAFVLDTVAGTLFGKLMCFVTRGKINPLIGACGISAFPMAARISAKVAQEEDFDNYILMHAMGSNTAGQLGSVIAGGLLLVLATSVLGPAGAPAVVPLLYP